MPAMSSPFLSVLTRALRRARHFALLVKVPYPTKARFQSVAGLDLSPTHPSLRSTTSIMIASSNSPVKRSGLPNRYDGVLFHTMGCSGLARVRTELFQLLIIPLLAPHPVHTDGQSAGHGDLGDLPSSSQGQMEKLAPPFRIAPYRDLGRFYQQETHQPTTLFADMSQPSPFPTGVFLRNQTEIGRDLLATLKPLRLSDDQHVGQGRQRTHSGMGHQSLGCGIFLHFLFDLFRELGDGWSQSIQQLQQIVAAAARPRRQANGLQLLASALSPQPLLTAQAFIQSYRLQLVHDPGAHLHHPMAVPQQLPQIAIVPARYPDLGKIILQHELQNMPRILPIRLLLTYSLGLDLGRVPPPQLHLQFRQKSLKPAGVSAGFHTHTTLHSLRCQITIKPLGLLTM